MNILIIANFCRDFSKSDNGRFMYLCKELSKENDVEIITSSFSHVSKKTKNPLTHNWSFKITFLHEPGYKRNISIKRFMSHHKWGKEVKKYLENRKKPDVIYCAVPSLTAPSIASDYCKKNDVKFVIDIQDLWPEAFQMVFNPPILNKIVYAPFKRLADKIYSNADGICAVSNTYANRAMSVNSKCKNSHVVFLGTNLDTFDKNVIENPVDKPEGEIWIAYCGTLGASYDLTCVIDALAIIKEKGLSVPKFIVMGDGPRRVEFEEYSKKKNVDCIFTGRLAYPKMCGLLSACDMTVNPIVTRSAGSIINKHGDYAASELPVINTQECQEYRDLVDEYKMGFNCENGDSREIAEKIILLVNDSTLRTNMGGNARRCAEEKFDRKSSYQLLIDCILG
ncbi:glycosyltransferase family 4 protein [Ruminococcus sp.]|uniref:glycosyltransferase family 4 protein n=1 Tax=Ruminococcus sp. TaxID=41978 RepID=UPI0025E26463|nr:glycosyltransferase family 4 protein [Ruminococcus sp.]